MAAMQYQVKTFSDGPDLQDNLETELATLGQEGWTLVSFGPRGADAFIAIFKRSDDPEEQESVYDLVVDPADNVH